MTESAGVGTAGSREWLLDRGATPTDLARHYELGTEFYTLWLASNLGYSCALWRSDDDQTLEQAELAKIDFFATELAVGPGTTVLDVGCGWGGPATRLITHHRAAHVVGLTLSPAHVQHCSGLGHSTFDVRLESWVDHEPGQPYDRIICFEAIEHFANEQLTRDERIAVYSRFFERAHRWLTPRGRMGVQVICFDSVGYERARAGAPVTDLVRTRIFPRSSPPHLSELVTAWEPFFAARLIRGDAAHYARTFGVWLERLQANRSAAEQLVGVDGFRDTWKYLAGVQALFRLRAWTLHRIVLEKRRKLKR
jgi:cyclopropane-fatty-acyl-phospholipid synthase